MIGRYPAASPWTTPMPRPCRSLLLILASLLSCTTAAALQLPGRVSYVVDGDSLVLDVRGSRYAVELAGIDAPELNQPWGAAAAGRLRQQLAGVFVVVEGRMDGPDRISGTIVLRGRDIGLRMIDDGLAWSLYRDDRDALQPTETPHPYWLAEQHARDARRGLWQNDEPVAPWEWRRGGAVR